MSSDCCIIREPLEVTAVSVVYEVWWVDGEEERREHCRTLKWRLLQIANMLPCDTEQFLSNDDWRLGNSWIDCLDNIVLNQIWVFLKLHAQRSLNFQSQSSCSVKLANIYTWTFAPAHFVITFLNLMMKDIKDPTYRYCKICIVTYLLIKQPKTNQNQLPRSPIYIQIMKLQTTRNHPLDMV